MRLVTPRWEGAPAIAMDAACVHPLIEAQAARTPDAIALVDRDRRITYRQLDERANRLANVLVARGVGAETPVGVACERSAEMIVALLAILKAGGAYVPIDPAHPRAWIAQIAGEARLPLVVTQPGLVARLAGLVTCVCVDDVAVAPASPPQVALGPDAAMYILFTSGSTGRPKGVVTTHRAIASRLRWQQLVYPYAAGEVACARTTLGFVDSVAEIFAPLAFGVPLVIVDGEAQRDPARMLAQLACARVTRIVLVPSLLATLLALYPDLAARAPSVRYWFVGGEPVPVSLVARFRQALPGRKLINLYGATEVSGDATWFDFDDLPAGIASSPIGAPLLGVHARIVDEALREVADGEAGEIVVSGVALSRGYLNRPELTAERFVANPFPEGGVLYKMGDLGRRMASGAILYLGRVDDQVKIRGMRVSLGEVEAVLLALPGVTQAIAVAREDTAGQLALIAFYTADRPTTAETLRAAMRGRVPDYMVPSRLVALDEFPRNANGKIDRRALGEHRLPADPQGEPPASDLERQVAAIWEAVLGLGPVGRAQDLFALGGTSLSAMRIAARLGDELGLAIPIRAVFDHPTIAAFTEHLTTHRAGAPPARPRPLVATGRPIPRELPLTSYQLPFWLFYAITGDLSVVGEVFAFTREVDIDRLQHAYAATVASFDALWMQLPRFWPVQRIVPRAPCRLEVRDRRTSTSPEADVLRQEAAANLTAPFALDRPPHVHARLVRLRSGDRLLVAVPHIAADMTAMELFRTTLQAHYAGTGVPPRGASLRDLIDWERGVTPAELAEEVAYWAGIGTGPATTTLPAHLFGALRAGEHRRAIAARELSATAEADVVAYSRTRGLSLPIAVIGAVYAALARVAVRDDPTLLLMLDKRDRPAMRDLFATLATVMRCRAPGCGHGTIDELVARLRGQLLASYDHSDHLMRRPAQWSDFWLRAPRPLVSLVRRACAALARRCPAARLDPEQLAQIVFAIVPPPAWGQGPRDIFACLNLWPEVTDPGGAGDWIVRARGLELVLKPGDLLIGTDPLVDRTLQITVLRTERGHLGVTLYGGGIDQQGLDELADQIVLSLAQLGRGRRVLA